MLSYIRQYDDATRLPLMTEILMVCTANACRSVMAGALLARQLAAAGRPEAVSVRTAGLLRDGDPPPAGVTSAMAALGIDVSGHRSQVVTGPGLAAADLVVTMAREQLRQLVVALPEVWPRAFTLKEILRRGATLGPRPSAEPLAGWLARAHAGRDRVALLGDSPGDDVADPTGGPPEAYAATAALLARLVADLAALCWPARPSPPPDCSAPDTPRVFPGRDG